MLDKSPDAEAHLATYYNLFWAYVSNNVGNIDDPNNGRTHAHQNKTPWVIAANVFPPCSGEYRFGALML